MVGDPNFAPGPMIRGEVGLGAIPPDMGQGYSSRQRNDRSVVSGLVLALKQGCHGQGRGGAADARF